MTLRVKPRPISQRLLTPRQMRLRNQVAGIGQRWLELQRAMGIEPKTITPATLYQSTASKCPEQLRVIRV